MPQMLSGFPVTLVVFLLILIFSLISFFNKQFFYKMLLHPYDVVHNRHYYRLLTSDLVHNDPQHFILNGLSLLCFCGGLEKHLRHTSAYGSVQFFVIYLASMLTGNLIVTWRQRDHITFSTAGASGSILGCLFGLMYLEPNTVAFYLPVIGAVTNEYYAVIYIILMVILRKRIKNNGASYELHFWGALAGLLATIMLTRH